MRWSYVHKFFNESNIENHSFETKLVLDKSYCYISKIAISEINVLQRKWKMEKKYDMMIFLFRIEKCLGEKD